MFETTLHRQVAVAALVALAAFSGAVAAAPDTADVSTSESDLSAALADHGTTEETTNETTTEQDFSATVVHEGERLVVRQAQNQTIRVETDADSGTELVVVAKAGGQFLKTDAVTVTENGTATATFDFSDVAAETDFTVGVRRDRQSRVDGTVVNDTATITSDEPLTVTSGSNLTVRGETTADPGTELVVQARGTSGTKFLETDSVTVSDEGTFEATFDLEGVEAGTEFEVSMVSNATLRSGPVEGNVEGEETTTAETTQTTEAPLQDTTTETTTGTEDPGVPGFGVPVALVALLSGLVLARRV